MRFTDGYDAETEEGRTYVRPFDVLIQEAISLVPRDQWQLCPVCKQPSPLFFGIQNTTGPDPYGMKSYHCAACQIKQELNNV